MIVVTHDEQPWEEWRPGVHSRAWATAATGARQVRIAEQTLEPGCEAPLHWHYFEENITVVEGVAEFTVGGETAVVETGHTVIVTSAVLHGFRSVGDTRLRIIASMGWPINEMNYAVDDQVIWRAGEIANHGARRKLDVTATSVSP